ncbi:NADH-quinone oxidoreductase subunit NuoK [Bacillus kwashiorkori]|uniref:NADH-quinone oxidoreductase subunit NuoK n=1 Tax=Bacillus kwashiorkori TaxID=1522318 RepID=UPI00078551B8|nr:NADH-quinone oxidoreductase subunit NuoK [Bacillus kwashiorkori]
MESVPLSLYLILALLLFSIGLFGALTKKNIIMILICIELMLNAVNINFVAFSKFGAVAGLTGQIFSIFIMTVAAAEVAVGIAILIALFRHKESVHISDYRTLQDS